MTPDEIEASLQVPEPIAAAMLARRDRQERERGEWRSPREADQPDLPWPDQDNPVLRFLLWKMQASLDAGMDPQVAMLQLAVHAWFEGGIEGYDAGQRDARRPRAV